MLNCVVVPEQCSADNEDGLLLVTRGCLILLLNRKGMYIRTCGNSQYRLPDNSDI